MARAGVRNWASIHLFTPLIANLIVHSEAQERRHFNFKLDYKQVHFVHSPKFIALSCFHVDTAEPLSVLNPLAAPFRIKNEMSKKIVSVELLNVFHVKAAGVLGPDYHSKTKAYQVFC